MFVIGLTGGIGSGKSTVAALFEKKGITVIDTDQLARDVTKPGTFALKKMVEYFGVSILHKDGQLDRSLLRTIVFNDAQKRKWLEKLLHPLIREELQKNINNVHSSYCIVIIPLLFETEKNPIINRILVVDSPENLQIQRAVKRDQSSEHEIKKIIESQIDREKRKLGADDVILNDGSLEDLEREVSRLHVLYSSLSREKKS